MRKVSLLKSPGTVMVMALLLGITAVVAVAQQDPSGVLPFPTTNATIVLTDSSLDISPSQLNPGPVIFTITNNSSRTRGVYVTGDDRVGDRLLRFSARFRPGQSGTMLFWLFEGQRYSFHDFTSRRVSRGRSIFASNYATRMDIPNPLPFGSGPSFTWLSGTITITNAGIEVSPQTSDLGPIVFTIINNSSKSRGVILHGPDRTGSPIFRYSKMVRPGGRSTVNFWLFEGQTYTVQDFTRLGMVRGAPKYKSSFSTTVQVNPGRPAPGS